MWKGGSRMLLYVVAGLYILPFFALLTLTAQKTTKNCCSQLGNCIWEINLAYKKYPFPHLYICYKGNHVHLRFEICCSHLPKCLF